MAEHATEECQGCGNADDHPKLHYANPTGVDSYHFDCIPAKVERDVTSHKDSHPQHAAVARTIATAKGGKHGQQLRDHIVADHKKTTAPALDKLHAQQAAQTQEA